MNQARAFLPQIDVLRALAILLVFHSHYTPAWYGNIPWGWEGSWYAWKDDPSFVLMMFRLCFPGGHAGVCLFFAISGFCIRLSHAQAADFTLTQFHWRRVWRIWPPYLVALAIFVALGKADGLTPGNLLSHVFLVHNISPEHVHAINGPFWSLALEFQVYLLYPVLLWLYTRASALGTGVILALLSMASAVVGGESFRTLAGLPDAFAAFRHAPTTLWVVWYAGFLVAEEFTGRLRIPRGLKIAAALVGLLSPLCALCRPLSPLTEPASALGLLAILSWALQQPSTGILPRLLAPIGLCSYSFYLYFDPILPSAIAALKTLGPWIGQDVLFWLGMPAVAALITLVSRLAYRWIELPGIAWGNRLWVRLRNPRAAAA